MAPRPVGFHFNGSISGVGGVGGGGGGEHTWLGSPHDHCQRTDHDISHGFFNLYWYFQTLNEARTRFQ